MITGSSLRKLDVVTSLLFIAFGVGLVISALRMPWGEDSVRVQHWYTSPGLFPLVLGVLLIAFSSSVLLHALRAGGHHHLLRSVLPGLRDTVHSPVTHRVLLMFALMGMYVFGLSTVFGYYTGSIGFLLAFMLLFHRRPTGRRTATDYALIILFSVLVPVLLGLAFERVFMTPLP